MGSGKQCWKISIYKSSSTTSKPETRPTKPPSEFICSISGSLMVDPVIVSTGQTFERASITTCKTLGYNPTLNDGSILLSLMVIPNLALKSSVVNWAKTTLSSPLTPLEVSDIVKLLKASVANSSELIGRVGSNSGFNLFEHADSELTRRTQIRFDSAESLSGLFRKMPLIGLRKITRSSVDFN